MNPIFCWQTVTTWLYKRRTWRFLESRLRCVPFIQSFLPPETGRTFQIQMSRNMLWGICQIPVVWRPLTFTMHCGRGTGMQIHTGLRAAKLPLTSHSLLQTWHCFSFAYFYRVGLSRIQNCFRAIRDTFLPEPFFVVCNCDSGRFRKREDRLQEVSCALEPP